MVSPRIAPPGDPWSQAAPSAASRGLPVALYVVEAERLRWFIRHNGVKFHGYADRNEAVVAAIDTAQRSGEWGFDGRVAVLTDQGQEKIIWTYGLDPHPSCEGR